MYAAGHGMQVQDFINSANAVADVIAQPRLSVGQRILRSVEVTQNAVHCNTNLGIILLTAPLIHAVLNNLNISAVVQRLSINDAEDAFNAIRMASPAGLGSTGEHDVREVAQVSLLTAMKVASKRDRIAFQYENLFIDIKSLGIPRYMDAFNRWKNESWAVTAVFFGFFSAFLDSHIVRKHGLLIAETIRKEASMFDVQLMSQAHPENIVSELLQFDASLKARGINPGTSADLTVATIFYQTILEEIPSFC